MNQIVTASPQLAANELLMCKTAAEKLHRTYPGHLWAVDIQGGTVLNVRNMALSGQWGFTLRLPTIYSASEFDRQLVRAGGELLERYRVSRSRNMSLVSDQIAALPVDARGLHRPDL